MKNIIYIIVAILLIAVFFIIYSVAKPLLTSEAPISPPQDSKTTNEVNNSMFLINVEDNNYIVKAGTQENNFKKIDAVIELYTKTSKLNPNIKVEIKAHKDISYIRVIETLTAIKAISGDTEVKLLTD